VIPDEKLGAIFREMYLTNAYFNTVNRTPTDSMELYKTLLDKYGYTLEDLQYTVNNFSRRKSAKLADVIELAIDSLTTESRALEHRVAALDSIDARGSRLLKATLFQDSMIRVKRVRDTAKLRLSMPVREGEYLISYSYKIDSADKNAPLSTSINIIDKRGRNSTSSGARMSGHEWSRTKSRLKAGKNDSVLQILFAGYDKKKVKLSTPNLTIDSFRIDYFMPREQMLDSLAKLLLAKFQMDIPTQTKLDTIAKDSSTLHTLSLGPVEGSGGDN
jgi:hypothetical protein